MVKKVKPGTIFRFEDGLLAFGCIKCGILIPFKEKMKPIEKICLICDNIDDPSYVSKNGTKPLKENDDIEYILDEEQDVYLERYDLCQDAGGIYV